MSKEKKAPVKKVAGSDSILKTVTGQLTNSLSSLKADLGEKKFKKRIKKAAKMMVAGLKKTPVKKAPGKKAVVVKKKTAKKAASKKKK